MKTEIITENIAAAAEIIRSGGLVAVPTETVYGLAGNGLDETAVNNIYEVKGRPSVKPLSLMVPGKAAMQKYCDDIPEEAEILADKFWPGPLTIVLKAKNIVPEIVRAGGSTVGLRCPDHPMTLKLLELAELPFAAPSANPSGSASPKNADEVMKYFTGKIPAVVDGGQCGIGMESTLIDMSSRPFKILRQGALSERDIAQVLADNMETVGITGGTGCGKTTALEVLKNMGALVLDCDEIYHRLLADSEEMNSELAAAFPQAIVNGKIDRKTLGAVVFNDEAALRKLNEITHRYVKNEVHSRLRNWAMQGGSLAALDAIELIGSGLADECKITFAVTADRETQIERIMAREGISREYASLRVDAQHSGEYFEKN
ncbi:MAG: L-threonylcarbamoyladenylate synthase, partial [Candidatus Limivicinus sp.]